MLNNWKNDAAKPNGSTTSDHIEPSAINEQEISIPSATEPKAMGNSTIDACLTMRGDLESDADILVKGKIFGNVSCNLVIVDEGAHIEGGVQAKEVVIRGKVDGIVKAEKVRLDKTAIVESDVYQNIFVAEEGARIIGMLKSLKDAPKGNEKTNTNDGPNATKQ